MKVFLMHADRDFVVPEKLDFADLVSDLGLDTLFDAMARGDEFLRDVVQAGVLRSLGDAEQIAYRQQVLDDCLRRPEIVRATYDVATEAITARRRVFSSLMKSPSSVLRHSVDVLDLLSGSLRRLRELADEHAGEFFSPGFTRFWRMLRDELDDTYLEQMDDHLRRLRFPAGEPFSARLGAGNKGIDYQLRAPRRQTRALRQLLPFSDRAAHTFAVDERDIAGARALSELRDRGVNEVANVLGQSTDHVLNFFRLLRAELGFYVGCLNLHERLVAKEEPVCVPTAEPPSKSELSCQALYDVCLSLRLDERVVGNDIDTDGKPLIVITGANQGGKSTFLRSLGQAQLMMQCGMFVPARSFRASACTGLFAHYKREEDTTMNRGRLDDELARMSAIVDRLEPGGLLLCNESFSSTNEREGSQIARTLLGALTESDVRVAFVTHLVDLATGLYDDDAGGILFLRAEREPDGRRTFRLAPGRPLPTSYGQDLYRQVFGDEPETSMRARSAAGRPAPLGDEPAPEAVRASSGDT